MQELLPVIDCDEVCLLQVGGAQINVVAPFDLVLVSKLTLDVVALDVECPLWSI